jgi:hypothetical protein
MIIFVKRFYYYYVYCLIIINKICGTGRVVHCWWQLLNTCYFLAVLLRTESALFNCGREKRERDFLLFPPF